MGEVVLQAAVVLPQLGCALLHIVKIVDHHLQRQHGHSHLSVRDYDRRGR